MKLQILYVLLVCSIITTGCVVKNKTVSQEPKPSGVTRSLPAPRNATVVLPLLDKFRPDLGMKYIKDTLGECDVNVGSAQFSGVYSLDDKTTIMVKATMPGMGSPREDPPLVLSIERQGEGITGIQVIYDSKKEMHQQ
jgi:hypothetical protein